MPQIQRFAVGFDRLFTDLAQKSVYQNSVGNYPPYNIVRLGDTSFAIEVAVAGFAENEIEVIVENNELSITGTKTETDTSPDYLHQGISARAFTRKFSLAEHVNVVAAKTVNGLLVVSLEKVIPEEKKPRKIEISFEK